MANKQKLLTEETLANEGAVGRTGERMTRRRAEDYPRLGRARPAQTPDTLSNHLHTTRLLGLHKGVSEKGRDRPASGAGHREDNDAALPTAASTPTQT